MGVRLSRLAKSDLASIGDHIAREGGPARARSFLLALRNTCRELATMPERFQRLEGFEGEGLRRRVFGNYLIVYRVRQEVVEVLRVFHGARDLRDILEEYLH